MKSSCCEMSFLSWWDGSKTALSTKCVVCWSLSSLQSAVVSFGPNMPKSAKICRSPVSGTVWEACGEGKLRLDHFLINVWSSRILDLFERLSIIKAQHLSLPFQNAFLVLPFITPLHCPEKKWVLIKERHNSLSSHLNSLYKPSQQTHKPP